jgi:hypothetical protein
MLIINRETVEELQERLKEPTERKFCLERLQKMLEIKRVLLWRAEAAESSCSLTRGLSTQFDWEVSLLEKVMQAVEEGESQKASQFLSEYVSRLS